MGYQLAYPAPSPSDGAGVGKERETFRCGQVQLVRNHQAGRAPVVNCFGPWSGMASASADRPPGTAPDRTRRNRGLSDERLLHAFWVEPREVVTHREQRKAQANWPFWGAGDEQPEGRQLAEQIPSTSFREAGYPRDVASRHRAT